MRGRLLLSICHKIKGTNENARYKSVFNLYDDYIGAADFSEHLYKGK